MLLIDVSRKEFNPKEIARGTLICAKHKSWDEWQAGIVAEVSGTMIRVLYLPSVYNVQNHYFIRAEEVENGEWEIRYSPDALTNIKEYPEKKEEGGDEDGSE